MENWTYQGRLLELYCINQFQMRTRWGGGKKSEHFVDIIFGGSPSLLLLPLLSPYDVVFQSRVLVSFIQVKRSDHKDSVELSDGP